MQVHIIEGDKIQAKGEGDGGQVDPMVKVEVLGQKKVTDYV